ncbi:hypothetical protein NL676_020921 [Syzygium grande]|nr:hypothetical protein NL676_020921 [Syzygium grande]
MNSHLPIVHSSCPQAHLRSLAIADPINLDSESSEPKIRRSRTPRSEIRALVKRGRVRESKLVQNLETRWWRQPKQRVSREGKKEKTERRDPASDDAVWGLAGGGGGLAGGACVRWSGLVVDWRLCTMRLLVGGGGGESGDEVAGEAEQKGKYRDKIYIRV